MKEIINYLRTPCLSPDDKQIAFSHAGDIWLVSSDGGKAKQITSHPNYDENPSFSPDGKSIAFMSTRTGNGDIYVISLETDEIKRLTFDDSCANFDCWSPDGKWLYFSSAYERIGQASYKVSINGGTPIKIACDPYESHYNLAISPDGKKIAFNNNGHQWWRHGKNPSGGSDIWISHESANENELVKFTEYQGLNRWPMWDSEAKGLYFVSDRDGEENIWHKSIKNGELKQLTHFKDGRVIRASIGVSANHIVFERNFGIWKLDIETCQANPVDIEVNADQKYNPINHRTFDNVEDFVVSPDSKKIVLTVHGEIFAVSAEKGTEKGRPAFRVTDTPYRESQMSWSPDSKKVAYISDRGGDNQIFLYDFIEKKENQLTNSSGQKYLPKFSPDGKWLAYFEDREEIRLINIETQEIREFISGHIFTGVPTPSTFEWSHDSKWLAFIAQDDKFFSNLYVQNIDEEESKQISFLSNIYAGNVLWAPNGKFIIFNTMHYRTENQIARVDLKPVEPEFKEEEFEKLFEEEKKETDNDKNNENDKEDSEKEEEKKEPVKIEFDDIKHRLRFLTSFKDNARAIQISPDSKHLIFAYSITGKDNLWCMPLEEDKKGEQPKQLTSSDKGKGSVYFTKNGKKIYYSDGGKIHYIGFKKDEGEKDGDAKALETKTAFDIDLEQEKIQVFDEAWRLIRDHFYDPEFHGCNWDAIYDRFRPVALGTKVKRDFREVLNLMIGELNASHLGTGGGGGGSNDSYLGVEFERDELENNGLFKIKYILPEGPVDLAKDSIKVGEYILKIDDENLENGVNLSEKIYRKTKRKVVLTVNDKPELEGSREVAVRPVSSGEIDSLRYKNWVKENANYVDKISNGRLGYAHIRSMSYGCYIKFMADLDTETHSKDGVVIDVRFNGGGHIASFILDILHRRAYSSSSYRGKIKSSSTNLAGNRILDKPTIVVLNEHSGSNTEMFSEGYRKLGLGKLVGTPSAGAVIWTWGWGLLDGSSFRLPRVRVSTLEDENLEGSAREVDYYVERPLGESDKGEDSQLKLAVEELLKQIDS